MVFSSLIFIFRFMPLFFLCYFLTPKSFRNLVLFLGSIFFYAVGEPVYIFLMLFTIFLNFLICVHLAREHRDNHRKWTLIFAMILDFGLLFLFKYFDFFAQNLNLMLHKETLPLLNLTLPLGISFYTFQIVSYVGDVYTKKMKHPGTLLEFATYVCMFPQLIAGPIVRYDEIADRMKSRRMRIRNLENGLKLFTLGLGLKVLLANQIGTLWNTIMSAGAGELHPAVAWLGAAAYSFQIYFDFWGYSVMAMGLGKMLGFRIPQNFDSPYASRSVSEFWRRWHITLGRWFREYVYFPLGGNRKNRVRTVCNLFIVWALTGLWHGADWNFVLWGLLFFVILTIEKNSYGKRLERTKVIGRLYTLAIIPITWVVFAITDIRQLGAYLGNMFGIQQTGVMVGVPQLLRYLQEYGILLTVCILFATPFPIRWYHKWKDRWFVVILMVAIFWFSVREIMVGSNNPFLYFRF